MFCVADIGFTSLGYRELTIQQSYLSGCISVSYPLSAFLAMDCNNVSQWYGGDIPEITRSSSRRVVIHESRPIPIRFVEISLKDSRCKCAGRIITCIILKSRDGKVVAWSFGDVIDGDVKYKIEINRCALLNRRSAGRSPAAVILSRISFYK